MRINENNIAVGQEDAANTGICEIILAKGKAKEENFSARLVTVFPYTDEVRFVKKIKAENEADLASAVKKYVKETKKENGSVETIGFKAKGDTLKVKPKQLEEFLSNNPGLSEIIGQDAVSKLKKFKKQLCESREPKQEEEEERGI